MMSINGTPESGPIKVGPSVVDYGTGFAAAFAIASALFQRERTGKGQRIDVSMLDCQLALHTFRVPQSFGAGIEFTQPSPRRGGAGAGAVDPGRNCPDTMRPCSRRAAV